jgi:asparagine synthase (glutamine-hydrolysing)
VAFDKRHSEFSEEEQAIDFAATQGVRHEVVRLEEAWILGSLDDVIAHMDQPTMDGVNTWAVSQAVKAHGITVALSGLGGDEVFGGYAHLRGGYEHRKAISVMKKAGVFSSWCGSVLGALSPNSVSARKIAALMKHARRPGGMYAVRRALFLPEDSMALVTDEVRRRWLSNGLEAMLSGHVEAGLPPAQESTLFEFQNYLPFTLLRDTDVMSMAHALEVRVPFLDVALVDFVLSLPLEYRFTQGRQKPLLAAAVPEIAAAGVIPKQGFTLPFEQWLRGPLRGDVETRLRDLKFAGAWVHPKSATRLFQQFLAGEKRLWTRVWAIYVLDRWLERLAGSRVA